MIVSSQNISWLIRWAHGPIKFAANCVATSQDVTSTIINEIHYCKKVYCKTAQEGSAGRTIFPSRCLCPTQQKRQSSEKVHTSRKSPFRLQILPPLFLVPSSPWIGDFTSQGKVKAPLKPAPSGTSCLLIFGSTSWCFARFPHFNTAQNANVSY